MEKIYTPAQLKWFEEHNFNEKGETFIIVGIDTYPIKDMLKAEGWTYNSLLGWHIAVPSCSIVSSYQMHTIHFDDVYNFIFDRITNKVYTEIKATAKEHIIRILRAYRPQDMVESQYIGEIGDKLVGIPVVLESKRKFTSAYGESNIFLFNMNGNILVWITKLNVAAEIGSHMRLSGTIKEFKEFRGCKQTRVTRCKITDISNPTEDNTSDKFVFSKNI